MIPFSDAIAHTLTVIRGHTGLAFTEDMDARPAHNAPVNAGEAMMVWKSQPVAVAPGSPVGLMADSVTAQISGVVMTPLEGGITYDPEDTMADNQFQIQVVMVFSRHGGGSFNMTRTLTFFGPHFFRFEN